MMAPMNRYRETQLPQTIFKRNHNEGHYNYMKYLYL